MNRKDFDIAAGIAERMDKLEKTIFELEALKDKKAYKICAGNDGLNFTEVVLEEGAIATELFTQSILQYYIDNLNLELDELRKDFEEI